MNNNPSTPFRNKTYRAGTLTYNWRSLLILFGWLLGGDFAFTFFESIFGRFLPLYLKDLQASNTLIGIMAGGIAGVVNILFAPGISQWSDRCRTRWGRRVPFLAVAAPLTVASLILVGFAPELGGWLHRAVIVHIFPTLSASTLTATTLTLALLCLFVTGFHFFNMILCNAFNWLVREVVPQEWMARFLSVFRIVATVSAVLFTWKVFPHVLDHRKEVCVSIGVTYLVVFLLMCWKVKEGDYPPPPPADPHSNPLRSFGRYFRDCFAVPLYRHYFYAIILFSLGSCAGSFYPLFFREQLKLSMADMGLIFTLELITRAVTYVPMSWLCDRFSSARIVVAAQIGLLALTVLGYFFIIGKTTLIIYTIVNSAVWVGWGLCSATLAMEIFPASRFAQYSTGTNVFGCGISIIGTFMAGVFMDWMNNDYRLAYLWAIISGLSFIPLILVYRGWKQHGGPRAYQAPEP